MHLKLVAKKGLEPLRPCRQQILSLSWLPLHHLAYGNWSEWRDLNPRQLAPKASGLPGCPTLGFEIAMLEILEIRWDVLESNQPDTQY